MASSWISPEDKSTQRILPMVPRIMNVPLLPEQLLTLYSLSLSTGYGEEKRDGIAVLQSGIPVRLFVVDTEEKVQPQWKREPQLLI
jgi:hypothetical protein